jgi:hypothetical protein
MKTVKETCWRDIHVGDHEVEHPESSSSGKSWEGTCGGGEEKPAAVAVTLL